MTHPHRSTPTVCTAHQTGAPLLKWGVQLTTAAALCMAGAAHAQHQHSASHAPATSAVAPALQGQATANTSLPWVSAEVRKVDAAAGKVTLKHEAIPNLDMPGMTMVFAVAQPQLLQGLQPGDKIQVGVEKVGGQYTVQALRR